MKNDFVRNISITALFLLSLTTVCYSQGDVNLQISEGSINQALQSIIDAKAVNFSKFDGSYGVSDYNINITGATAHLIGNSSTNISIDLSLTARATIHLVFIPSFDVNLSPTLTLNGQVTLAPQGQGYKLIITPQSISNFSATGTFLDLLVQDYASGFIKQIPEISFVSYTSLLPGTIASYFTSGTPTLTITNGMATLSLTIAPFIGQGGTISYSGGNTIHTFTSSGTFSCTQTGNVKVLVVGGGGGGGGTIRGGGGGGGIVYNASYSASGPISVTVGAGGAGGAAGETSGSQGGNSSFGSLTAIGGGSGDAGSGGSGGGANRGQTTGGVGTSGQGNNGGGGLANDNTCGGGGGAGAVGGSGSSSAGGNGGNGLDNSISGSDVYYAGGGGGGARNGYGTAGTGGYGGGGNGGVTTAGMSGTANTGGGGGAGGFAGGGSEGYRAGGNGGSGIVIVSYPTGGLYKSSQGNNRELAEEPVLVPTEYSLSQNYPNPFNPATIIRYQLPDAGTRFLVSLKVYDMLGREVMTLINGMKEAGYYSTTFDASRLASGIYFARVIASPENGNKPFTKIVKMLLMK